MLSLEEQEENNGTVILGKIFVSCFGVKCVKMGIYQNHIAKITPALYSKQSRTISKRTQ